MVLFFYLVVSFNSFFKRAISWVKFLLEYVEWKNDKN